MTSRALILQVPGANPIEKFGRMDTGNKSVWRAPNALMVKKGSAEVDAAVATVRRLIGEHQRPSPQPAAEIDPADQIRKFAQLRDEGLISEEEFAAKKARLLDL
jgi:hypothetical protein